jgi:GDPmannose 4,6-dehydratase
MDKRALITGINGMDGSHLADFLLDRGYDVFGLERRVSTPVRRNTEHLVGKVEFIIGDMTDQKSLMNAIDISQPDEVYNLAAQSFVGSSWTIPSQTCEVNALGVLNILEAIRRSNKDIRFYQASTSEMYGNHTSIFADEKTTFSPRSPYGVSKLFAHHMTINYRESFNMFACCGILFNHESERRGYEFVTRKISDGVAKIFLGLDDKITLGTLTAKRDWGYAPNYVEAMWKMLQQDSPEEFVIATGKNYSVEEFLRLAFESIGIMDWENYVEQDPKFMRPAEIYNLCGDSSKAKEKLQWTPKVSFEKMVDLMVQNDVELLRGYRNAK